MAASYISVPRDLTKVKSKVMFNLTKRQLICFGLAALVGVPAFFLIKMFGTVSTAVMGMMVIMMPFFFLAMYEKHGQPLEVIMGHFIQANFVRPKVRPCPICSADSSLCEGKVAEQPKEETTQSEEEKMGPLTPKGNLSLVDDYGTIEAGGKQFMTVVTKSGKYFYIIIDRDDKGTETVHFLNLVDESDLLALMDEEQVEEYMAKTGTDENEETTEIAQPVKEASAEETEKEEVKPVEDKPKKNNNSGLIIGLLVLILGGGAGFMYVKNTKSKKNTSTGIDPDMDYDEEDEDYLSTLPKDEEDIDVNDDLEEESEEDSEEE